MCVCVLQAMLNHWTKKIIVEEGHTVAQLVHILYANEFFGFLDNDDVLVLVHLTRATVTVVFSLMCVPWSLCFTQRLSACLCLSVCPLATSRKITERTFIESVD